MCDQRLAFVLSLESKVIGGRSNLFNSNYEIQYFDPIGIDFFKKKIFLFLLIINDLLNRVFAVDFLILKHQQTELALN